MNGLSRIFGAAVVLLSSMASVSAAELKVFCTIGVQPALEVLLPGFEQASGDTLSITWATAAILVRKVEAGETADALILSREGLDQLVKAGRASSGTDAVFASSGMAVVVRHGAPRPDISTVEAFRQALLAARSVAYSNPTFGGASGV